MRSSNILVLLGALLAAGAGVRAEIIDRIAVTVDKMVITESDVLNQMRIAALENGVRLRITPRAKRQAAARLVEQVLIRREMEISRYPAPAASEVKPMLEKLRARYPNAAAWRAALKKYGVTEKALRENLLLQLTVLRFIDYRFRPGITVEEKQIADYYARQFVPRWKQRSSAPPPPLEQVHDEIQQILISQQVNQALDRWLKQARTRAHIRYHQEAFQ